MEKIAEVLINKPAKMLDRTFSYCIPPHAAEITQGYRVAVPFGAHTEEGTVLFVRGRNKEDERHRLLYIRGVTEHYPWFTPEMLRFAEWISSYYICTRADALRLFMIDKKGITSRKEYRLNWEAIPAGDPIRDLIDEGVAVIPEKAAGILWGNGIQELVRKGFLLVDEVPETVYRPPLERWIERLGEMEETDRKRKKKQAELADLLRTCSACSCRELEEKGFSSALLRTFCKEGYGRIRYREKKTFSLVGDSSQSVPFALTEEQESACRILKKAVGDGEYKPFLLHGVTGSGKTEVYLRAAEEAIADGGNVLILVPEIALTDQMVSYFAARFGRRVVFIHSKLSKGERYNNRTRIRNGESPVVIGSRSALFMPFRKLKLIAVDEEYDSSYKQDETPRYNGRDAAKMLAVIHNCPLVLGASTPSVSTYYAAQSGKIGLIKMTKRVHDTRLPRIYIVDMREEYNAGTGSLFSRALLELVRDTAANGEKSILFLNRRGYSTSLICQSCGHVFKCPHCDVALVYHKHAGQLKCHYCEAVFPIPRVCPECGKPSIRYTGTGTEKAEELFRDMLPGISCCRLDLDSTRTKYGAQKILKSFREGDCQVLLGTQMVSKGHDIPGVQAVGILSADNMLNFPSYLAAERTFSLITQSAGRAGRRGKQGEVILQTFNPDSYVIRTAQKQDYDSFYSEEIQLRRAFRYPPFSRMMKITCFAETYEKADAHAQKICQWLKENVKTDGASVTPPYDEAIVKKRNDFYISILVKADSLAEIKTAMRSAPLFRENGIIIDVDPL